MSLAFEQKTGVAREVGSYEDFTGMVFCGGTEGYVENATFEISDYLCLRRRYIGRDADLCIIFKKGKWIGGTWETGYFENGVWCGGKWKYGYWWNGYWMDGIWHDGYWSKGTWYNGTWEDGIWERGDWYDGTWKDGCWKDGTWRGGTWMGGTWKNGKWLGGTWKTGFDKCFFTHHVSPDNWR